MSEGTLALLEPEELWAVIHHERGHAREHHGIVMLPMVGVRTVFGWMPYARYAPINIGRLLEMAADDFSSRRSGRRPLAAALVEMAGAGWAPSCGFAAAGTDVAARVARLLDQRPTSKASAALASVLALGSMLVPISVALLA